MSDKFSPARIVVALLLLIACTQTLAHEGWILTPAEILEWNNKTKPALFTQWSATNVIVLGSALMLALGLVRLGFAGARELFPDLQARLASYGDFSAVILRICLAWTLLASALALEPRVGNELFQSPTLLAPDLELQLLEVLLSALVVLGLVLFGREMFTYLTAVSGICIYLLLQGPGSRYVPLPVVSVLRPVVVKLASVPRQRAQFLLRILAGLNFLYLGIYFKVLQPNLALGILETYQVPILSKAPEFFVWMMAIVETFTGIFVLMGVMMRPVSVFLLCAFIFLATDKKAHIVILGGGIAAMRAAMKLEKLRGQYTNVSVTLVTPNSEFVYSSLLPEVIGGSIQPTNIVNSMRRILPATRIVEANLQALDATHRKLEVKRSSGNVMSINYDELILAQGSVPDFNGISGLPEYGLAINSIGDALYLRQSVMNTLAEAEHEPDAKARRALLTFTVIGGCERGCGTAMEIQRLLRAAASSFPMLRQDEFKVVLFENSNEAALLPPAIRSARNQLLQRYRIDLRDVRQIASITASTIRLNVDEKAYPYNDSELPCSTTVNAGLRIPENGLQHGRHNRVLCDAQLRVTGNEHVWLAGDNSELLEGCLADHGERIQLGEKAAYNGSVGRLSFATRLDLKLPYGALLYCQSRVVCYQRAGCMDFKSSDMP